jgi:hypothetical protein
MTDESNELETALAEAHEHWVAIQRELAARHVERVWAGTKRNTRKFRPTLVKRQRPASVKKVDTA